MFCRKCYTELNDAADGKCPKCALVFDSTNPKTFLNRPFPTAAKIILQIVLTTVFGILCAYVVAFHQAVQAVPRGGH